MHYSHQLATVHGGPNEVAPWTEVLACIPQHHVSLGLALKGVVDRELAAGEVKPHTSILIPVSQANLDGEREGGGERGGEGGGEGDELETGSIQREACRSHRENKC